MTHPRPHVQVLSGHESSSTQPIPRHSDTRLDPQWLLDVHLDLGADLHLDDVALALGGLEGEEGVPRHVDGVDGQDAEVGRDQLDNQHTPYVM
jgi:hypothetical protein